MRTAEVATLRVIGLETECLVVRAQRSKGVSSSAIEMCHTGAGVVVARRRFLRGLRLQSRGRGSLRDRCPATAIRRGSARRAIRVAFLR